MRTLEVRLRNDVRDMAGIPEVVGALYLPPSKDEWEPALTGGDLDRFLGWAGDEEPGRPQRTKDDGEDRYDLS